MNHRPRPGCLSFRLAWPLVLLLALAAAGVARAAAENDQVAAPKNVAELKAIQARIESVVAKVVPCTVGVRIGPAQGSGVIVSGDGLVMTAGHVVGKPGQDVTFLLADGKSAKGKTLGAYKTADAGLMKITEAGKWPFVERGRSAELKSGAWCVAVGHPLGYRENRPPVVRIGRVLRAAENVIQTDCPLVGGDSGGPLFDLDGKLIGINSRIGGSTSQNFHVPIDIFHEHWDRLLKGEAWERDLPSRDSKHIKTLLQEVVAAAAKCAVRIKCDGKDAALGTIVGPDGWILTKASELKGKTVCRLQDGRELEARTVGIDPRFDLAMLKVDAFGLPRIDWSKESPGVGQWVAAPGLDGQPLALGIVSVPRRPVPPLPGILGVVLKEAQGGAEIENVLPKSPAEKAGLKPGDLITALDGKATPNRKELIERVRKLPPGTEVKLTVKRSDKQLEIKARLAKLETPASRKRDMQNALGVGLSKRRDAFPLVLQHDTVLRPLDCGGPLVGLGGKVLGVNIARGGRTETYCVPSDVLITLMYDLMSGRLVPPDVLKEREKAAEKAKAEQKAAEEKKKVEQKAAEQKAAEEKKKVEQKAAEQKAAEEKAAEEKAAEEKAAEQKAAEDKKKAEQEEKQP